MQEFWATATVHHHAIQFKMDNKKHIVNLESFKDMLHICLRVHGQSFDEPPFEEEILAFIRFLRHSAVIRTLTDVSIKKLFQPWRSFEAIINKFLTGKSSGYDSLRLSQAQILWGLYHKRNIDYAYLLWEDLVYQVEHKNTKKSNEKYYPRFTKVIIHYFMLKDPSILRRNKLNWHYVRDDYMFSTIRLGKQTAKASKAKSLSALSKVAMTEAQQLKLVTKRRMQQTHISQASGSGADEGTGSIPGVPDAPTDESKEELSWNSTDDEGDGDDDDDDDGEEGNDDDDDQEVEMDDDKDDEEEGNGEEDLGLNIGWEEGHVEKDEEDELYRDVNINQGRGIEANLEVKDSHVTLTPSDRLRDEAQRENDEFLKTVDENIQKIIKEQVKEQVKVQVSKILARIKQAVNEQLEAEVLTRSSHSSKTSYRRRDDDADKDEEPSDGPDRGSKRRREEKEPESASAPTKTATRSAGRSTQGSQSQQASTAFAEEPMQTTCQMEEPSHPEFDIDAEDQPIVQSSQLRRDDDKLYKFKEGDFKRLRIQDIEDILLLLVQGKLTNLTVEERFAFNVSLQMFTRSIIIQRHVEDLLLGVESYQKKLNLTKLDSYRSDLKRKEAYTAYSNPRGFIYQNKDKKNRTVDENIKKIIKEQVKEQVKAQVSKFYRGLNRL
uniref:Uncharacterized protein n=1 Tax=Tanacetum cinerariifolium TaxID=118510 RepID=A0A6L2P5Z2_TANCI|nr:hypothetical protein [Tanacetum cinerariifolium]